jgi:hypothetical protein
MQVVYYVCRTGQGWSVQSRGFSWSFDSCQDATQFAVEMAERYADASGRTTQVRLQDPDGRFHEIRSYGGIVQLPSAVARALGTRRPAAR